MYQDTRRLDFHALGREIKRKREAKGWTQEYLAQLVDRTPRSIMYFENRGQHPSLNTFYKIVTLLGHGDGIYVYALEDGHLHLIESTKTVNASFLVMDRTQKYLFSTNELKEYEGQFGGAVSSFAFNAEDGSLKALGTQPVHGADPCHVEVDEQGKFLYCANFMSGSVSVLPIETDGTLRPSSCMIQHEGSSIDPARQRGPHAHGIFFDPTGERIYVPDLGMDKTVCYRPQEDGTLKAMDECCIPANQLGAGPRHMVFHLATKTVYINTEMGNTVSAYRYDEKRGKAEWMQTLPTLPEGTDPLSTSTSAIKLHPSGRFLYVSNRGHNSLATYRIDSESGLLELLDVQLTGGSIPRDFEITPDGAYMIVAHQSSDDARLFSIDPKNGKIHLIEKFEVPTPICVRVYCF